MSKKFIAVAILGVFLFSGVAGAQANNLPPAGTLPSSPLFFFERFFEGVGTFFTFGEANKARRYLALSEERLAEAQALAEQQDDENTTKATDLYEEQLAEAKKRAQRTGEIDLEAEVTEATTKHLSVLDRVIERVPEQARERVRQAKERTMTGQIEALRGIAQRDPERAAGIFAAAAEGRSRAIQAKVEQGGDDEEEAEEVGEALGEYEKYAQFGKEISQIAQKLETGETEVNTLIERATEQHLQMLQDVKEKAPLKARENINRAIQNAERVRQFLPSDIDGQEDGVQESDSTVPDQGSQDTQEGSGEQDETNGGAPIETPAEGGGEDEGTKGGPPEEIPGAKP